MPKTSTQKGKNNVRVRMAPSPTGALHVGTARTALFNYLYAKHYGGEFVLRIEDTDRERSEKKWEEDIIEGLSRLQIEWDEGPDKGGEYGPYRQSERKDIYKKYIEKMLEEGSAFYCWHTKDELQAEQQKQMQNKEAPRHICKYKHEQEKADTDTKKRSIIRLDNKEEESIIFEDEIRGTIEIRPETVGDFSIAKDTKTALYHLAVVIDDHEMQISHVVRGEDHITNTPKQILLQKALGFERPKYAHLPLLLGSDRSKLSKRHGATAVSEYKKMGYLPEAMFNYLALLGWHPKDDKEIMDKDEIVSKFAVEDIQQSAAIFDVEKLNWMNGEYIKATDIERLTEAATSYIVEAGLITKEQAEQSAGKLKKIVELEQPRIKKLSEIVEAAEFFFKQPEYDAALLVWKKMSVDELLETLSNLRAIIEEIPENKWEKSEIEAVIMPKAEQTGNRGTMLWPLRAALSGRKASPGPFEILDVLGKEEALKRLKYAEKLAKKLHK